MPGVEAFEKCLAERALFSHKDSVTKSDRRETLRQLLSEDPVYFMAANRICGPCAGSQSSASSPPVRPASTQAPFVSSQVAFLCSALPEIPRCDLTRYGLIVSLLREISCAERSIVNRTVIEGRFLRSNGHTTTSMSLKAPPEKPGLRIWFAVHSLAAASAGLKAVLRPTRNDRGSRAKCVCKH